MQRKFYRSYQYQIVQALDCRAVIWPPEGGAALEQTPRVSSAEGPLVCEEKARAAIDAHIESLSEAASEAVPPA